MPKDTTNSDSCPLCGNKVSPNADRCSICGTPVRVSSAPKAKAKAPAKEDYLRKGIPKTHIPSAAMKCPLCAKELEGKESKCPRCGIPLVSKAEMLECPECGSLAPQGSKSCPSCGIGFEMVEEIPAPPPAAMPAVTVSPPVREKPVPAPPKPPERPPEVVTTVASSPQPPRAEGLVNGRGSIGGGGFVNGTGLVNGTGMTNGTKFETPGPSRERRQSWMVRRWQFLAVLVAVIVVIPVFIFLSYSWDDGAVSVDGDFGDWSDVQKFTSYTTSVSTTVNINEWAVQADGPRLFLYVKVEGVVMFSSEVSTFHLFVDSDDSAATGYTVAGVGADYMIELVGWDSSVEATALYRYGSTSDLLDWNKWLYISDVASAVDDDRLEASVELPVELGSNAKYLLVSQDEDAHLSASYPVPQTGGVLVINQEPGPGITAAGTVPVSGSVAFLRLRMTCDGTGGTIESLAATVEGATPVGPVNAISIPIGGEEKVATIYVDTLSTGSGTLVSARVNPDEIVSNFEAIIVLGSPVRAYAGAAPSSIQIDGAFGDWNGLTTSDGDGYPLANPNTDIDSVGAVNESTVSSFYVSVLGDICSGTYVPVLAAKPAGGGGGGGGTVLPRKGGEDILRIYIDADMLVGTGYLASASGKTIGADYKIEVRGMWGDIVFRSLSSYSAGSWVVAAGAEVVAANDLNEIELSVAAASISGASAIDFVVETTDWFLRKDYATALPQGSRALQTMANMISPESWIIDGGTNAQATAMSHQRKLFYDGVNIWSFYWDGSNTVYRYSADYGQTWSATARAFSTNGVNEVSVWYDSANSAVYAVGDAASASRNAYVQKGTVSASTHAITWLASDSAVSISSLSLGGKNSYVSVDASGYVWLLGSNLTSTTPDMYQLSAWRSASAGSVASFAWSGSMITGGTNNEPNIKGTILPAGSGSNVWTVYMYGGSVYARKYTGTWSAQATIFANADNTQNQDLAPASAVVDGTGVIHVVYGNGHQQPVGTPKPYIYYAYNAGSAWSTPLRLDTAGNNQGNYYPTISLDTSTGSVYAFWIFGSNAGSANTIQAKRNVSGTWTALTLPAQTANVKQYLTSIYSAPSENLVCWQWTQNTTAPIQLHFEKLPEFGSVLLPAFFVMVVCFASVRLHRKRR